MSPLNALGLPVGDTVDNWQPVSAPARIALPGRYCDLQPLEIERHAAQLHAANLLDTEHRIWTYLAYGPFDSLAEYTAWMAQTCTGDDPMFYAIIDKATGKAGGIASYLRIDPAFGVIEVGHLNFAPPLQQTIAATESMYLLARHVFDDLGYRRYEWKCHALNKKSCRAAQRYGFQYEGTFRQAMVSKGRNRDTAWYSILDSEWPRLREAFETWLAPQNFDAQGRQKTSLGELTGRRHAS